MAQLNVYVPDSVDTKIRALAKKAKKSVSKYIAELFAKQHDQKSAWPKDFFSEVAAQWRGDLKEIPRDKPDDIEEF
ncbi:MAG: hypothetical protein HQM16_01065 [Deltaproteobacteria bacterium]|nr:hypothetical protein [Deltaproteobacteria bacterium]